MTQAQLKEDPNQVTLYAQPYDLDAQGFYFTSFEDYETKYNKNCNVYGQPVEEYEIQFIDGSAINCALFDAVGSYNLKAYYKVVNIWSDWEKVPLIISYKDNIGKGMVLEIQYQGKRIEPGILLPKTSAIDLVLGNGKR